MGRRKLIVTGRMMICCSPPSPPTIIYPPSIEFAKSTHFYSIFYHQYKKSLEKDDNNMSSSVVGQGQVDNRNVHISVDVESSPDAEMESLLGTGEEQQPKKSLRRKEVSMSSVGPTMVLSWHGITAKPRREKSLIPFYSNIRSLFYDGEEPESGFRTAGQKYILNNVFGVAYPGEVLALMGASGAGKTSLLNILTQRNLSTMRALGQIRLNGSVVDKHVLRKISAYVQQDDIFIGTMTVVEHLRFMALMRMGKHYSARERERRVQNVMTELGLKNCANTIIGWPHRLKGLSGGERKRLAFASEIMTGPPILFCDEPTSGLDSYLAQQVIQVLKDLARRKNMTIVVTIHQPSSQVFEMFDKICLLADGRLAFLGTTPEAITFFDGLGHPLPDNFNPADHFISTLALEPGKSPRKAKGKINKICGSFLQSDLGKEVLESAQDNSRSSIESADSVSRSNSIAVDAFSMASSDSTQPSSSDESALFKKGYEHAYGKRALQRYKSTWCQQFWALTKRSFFVTLREPMLLKVRIVQTFLIALLLGAIYWQTPIRQSTVMNVNGLIFQAVANMNFMFQFAAVHIFCDELPIFMREHLANLYRVDAYFLAKNVAELVQYLLYPIIFATIVYWMSGFVRELSAYLLFTLSCIAITNVAVSLAYAAACIFGTTEVATAIMPILVIPLLAFAGFYINQASLPPYFYPLKFFSYFGYAYESAAINQWTRVGPIPGCNSTTTAQGPDMHGMSCYRDGMDVLDSLSFEPGNMLFDYIAMAQMILGFRLLAFFALWLRAVTKK